MNTEESKSIPNSSPPMDSEQIYWKIHKTALESWIKEVNNKFPLFRLSW